MLAKSMKMLDKIVDYTKQSDGSWHAELSQPIQVHVEGKTPNDCRWKIEERFDEALADWLEQVQKTAIEKAQWR